MTDEQNPTGEQPQDPTQPPAYGDQPAPPPPPAPVNPYEQQPVSPAPDAAAPPPYGAPQPPPYAQPAYGQPAYGQPGYPVQPGFPVQPASTEPSKAMAIIALVLSLLCCFPIGLILAIVVLVRSRDGRNHGRGLAIGAVVASVVSVLVISGLVVVLSQVDWDDLLPVEQLEAGECLNANNLTDDSEDFVEDITEVDCGGSHDAQVLVTTTLTSDQASTYDPASSTLCTDLIAEGGLSDKIGPEMGYFGLTTEAQPSTGDKLVCIVYNVDGSKLTAPL